MRTFLLAALVVCLAPLAVRAAVITEFMATNQNTVTDEDGTYSDWIEIYNPTGAAESLLGWSLTDNALNLRKWVFPAVTLQPGEYRLVFASSWNRTNPLGELHTNFRLSAAGEYLGLIRFDGTVANDFSPAYPPQTPDVPFYSYGLSPLDGSLLVFDAPTPGWQNTPEPAALSLLAAGLLALAARRRR